MTSLTAPIFSVARSENIVVSKMAMSRPSDYPSRVLCFLDTLESTRRERRCSILKGKDGCHTFVYITQSFVFFFGYFLAKLHLCLQFSKVSFSLLVHCYGMNPRRAHLLRI